MNIRNTLLSSLLFLLVTHQGLAQTSSEKFTQLIGAEPQVEINLGPTMLGLLSAATNNKEQGIAAILSTLKGINVTVFDIENLANKEKINSIRSTINKYAESKVSEGYEKIAVVKEDDSLVYILAKTEGEHFKSLSIFALDDDDELVLIDINGNIHISQIGDLMKHFDVDLDINNF